MTETATQENDNTQRNIKMITIGVVIVLAVTAITAILYNQKQKRQTEAQELLFQADKLLSTEATQAEKDKKEGNADILFSVSIPAFQKVVQNFSGTRASFEAQLRLGDLYLEKGPVSQAIKAYESAVTLAPKKWDRTLALYSLGYAYEENKEYPKAIEQFKKALDLKEGMKGELMLALARNQALSGVKDQAKTTYDQMIGELAQTPFAKEAEIRKARLE